MVSPDLNKVCECSYLLIYAAELSKRGFLASKIVFNVGAFRPGLEDGRVVG